MSYKSVREILNAVFDSDDSALKGIFKTDGEVLNMVLDESGDPALKVRIDNFTGEGGGTSGNVFRNLLINPNKTINHRNTSGTATGVYYQDRWFGNGAGLSQKVENCCIMTTGAYVLSWEGSATADVSASSDNVSYTLLGSALSSGAVVSLEENTYVKIDFSSTDFYNPQLEAGTSKTPFEYRTPEIELLLCKRYLYPITVPLEVNTKMIIGGLTMESGGAASGIIQHKLRATPVLQTVNTANNLIAYDGTGTALVSSISIDFASSFSTRILFASPGLTTGRCVRIQHNGNPSPAPGIFLTAEL